MATTTRLAADEADERARRAATGLIERGLGPGDRVAVIADPGPDYLCAVFGALRAGIVPVLLNPGLLDEELAPLLEDAAPSTILRDEEVAGLGRGRRPSDDVAPVPLARPMLYTSGTTGRPKGVWSGVQPLEAATAAVDDERRVWGFGPDDVNVVVSPLYHSAPMRFAIGTLLAGGEVVLPGRFEAHRLAEAIAAHHPTTAFMAPPHLQRLLALDERPLLDSFRLLAHAGAPCPEPLKRTAIEAFGEDVVWEFYGSTEGQFTACPAGEWLTRPGTVGRARPGRSLRVDGHGTVWCRPPSHARFEYWRDPVRTAEAWDDGWFTVGDLGRLDADGFLYLDGRRDDLIISGGVNVYPVEVEQVMHQCPGVDDIAVFALADERWGQMVCAAVVGAADEAALDDFAHEHLAAWKRPKRWVRTDTIATSATGKVQRSRLAAELGLT